MAKKRKINKARRVFELILLACMILLVLVVFVLYKKASKKFDYASFDTKNIVVEKDNISFDLIVNADNMEYYDIYLDSNGKTINVVSKSKDFNTYKSYNVKASYNTTYEIKVRFYTSMIGSYVIKEEKTLDNKFKTEIEPDSILGEGIIYDDFQIHFMMLGNDNAGDSIYIKAGNTDIVIDAGSKQSSTITTKAYMDQFITDGKIEYVILTHGDSDHVSGFTDTKTNKGLLSSYEIDNIIDNEYSNKTTDVYNKYKELRDDLVEKGTNHYYAGDCYNNVGDARRDIKLSENVTMSILYNYYYYNTSKDENNYSVCTMFTYKSDINTKYFMFTGDLEKEGEEKMASYYDGTSLEKTLPEVDLFKAGHHGSKTSSNECLLSIIKPKMCVVMCCCGTDEYTENIDNQFPTQAFIDRIAKYTDKVYITTTYEEYTIENDQINTSGFKPMNGNIIVSAGDGKIGLHASNNLTKLKDSEWINTIITINGKDRPMRVWPNS